MTMRMSNTFLPDARVVALPVSVQPTVSVPVIAPVASKVNVVETPVIVCTVQELASIARSAGEL